MSGHGSGEQVFTESVAAGESARAGGCREGFSVASFIHSTSLQAPLGVAQLGGWVMCLPIVCHGSLHFGFCLAGKGEVSHSIHTHTPNPDAALSRDDTIEPGEIGREENIAPNFHLHPVEVKSQPINTSAQHHSFASGTTTNSSSSGSGEDSGFPWSLANRSLPSLKSGAVTCPLNGRQRPVPFSPATCHLNPIRFANAGHYLDSPV